MIIMKTKEKLINHWLDLYNDYSVLYQMFGDKKYKDIMDFCIDKIRVFS